MLSDDFLRKLDALALPLSARVRGNAGGVRRSHSLGSSAEFSDFREYAPGDDIRRIDWNAYARFDKLFLKLFTEEQDNLITIVIDSSASMHFGEKHVVAQKLALMLTYIALRADDRVAIVAVSERVSRSQAFSGRAAYMKAVQFVDSIQFEGDLTLDEALPRIGFGARRGLCVLISDFMGERGFAHGCDSVAFTGQQLFLLQLLSRAELAPELDGAFRLIDAESGDGVQLVVTAELRRAYDVALRQFVDVIRTYAARHAALYAMLDTSDDFESNVLGGLNRAGMIS